MPMYCQFEISDTAISADPDCPSHGANRLFMKEVDAHLLGVPVGAAGLSIERISYLGSGRAVEFTRSLYRGDAYDFVAELTIGPS